MYTLVKTTPNKKIKSMQNSRGLLSRYAKKVKADSTHIRLSSKYKSNTINIS